MKSILNSIVCLGSFFLLGITSTIASATAPPTSGSVDNENIISCAMKNGSYVHSLLKVDDAYKAYIAFASYKKKPSQEILDRNKELYAQGIFPPDPRKHVISVPVGDPNYLSSNKETLLNRINFLESLYPKVPADSDLPSGFGSLELDFSKENCSIHENNGLVSAQCETSTPTIMNGVLIERIILKISNTKTLRMVDDLSKSSGMIAKTQNTILASVTFLHKNRYYRSSFTYEPNGNDSPCYVKKINLPEYDD